MAAIGLAKHQLPTGPAVWAQPRRLGVLGLTTFVKGEKNSPSETPRGAKIAANASTVTPLSPRSSLPT